MCDFYLDADWLFTIALAIQPLVVIEIVHLHG